MKVKELVKDFTFEEVCNYLEGHTGLRLPTFEEARKLETRHNAYWVKDEVGDRQGIYENGNLESSHVLFKNQVVLIDERNNRNE